MERYEYYEQAIRKVRVIRGEVERLRVKLTEPERTLDERGEKLLSIVVKVLDLHANVMQAIVNGHRIMHEIEHEFSKIDRKDMAIAGLVAMAAGMGSITKETVAAHPHGLSALQRAEMEIRAESWSEGVGDAIGTIQALAATEQALGKGDWSTFVLDHVKAPE